MNTYHMETGDGKTAICDVVYARNLMAAFRKAASAAVGGRRDWKDWEHDGREYRCIRGKNSGLRVRVTRAWESGFRIV